VKKVLIPQTKITSIEVARLAGVAHATVSRVVNNPGIVSPDTREKVLKAIRATGYKPSSSARMLVRQKHETVGLIFEKEHIKTYYGSCLIEGVSESLAENGQRLAMAMVKWHSRVEEIETLPLLRTVSVDGLILDIHALIGDQDAVVARLGLPYIFINPSGYRPYNTIMPDDVLVARDATQYLIARGHRKIAYIPGPGTVAHSSQADRMKGYAEGMIKAGLQPVPLWDVPLEKEDYPVEDYLSRVRIFKEKYGCTAIVAYDATEAPRILYAGYKLGLEIPQDFSLVACDYDPVMRVLPVAITCYHFDRTAMGKRAVAMLDQRIKCSGADIPSIRLDSTLIEGKSVISLT
jgi:DNA-binding LacI/PurR family transcriptional regulator